MSQETRNPAGERERNSGRENRNESRNPQGFEGMNYEQRRPPYRGKKDEGQDVSNDNNLDKAHDQP
jgi:hypothetical protein